MKEIELFDLFYKGSHVMEAATMEEIFLFMSEHGLHKDDCSFEPRFDTRDYDAEGKDAENE